jgi:hypothetical protein
MNSSKFKVQGSRFEVRGSKPVLRCSGGGFKVRERL